MLEDLIKIYSLNSQFLKYKLWHVILFYYILWIFFYHFILFIYFFQPAEAFFRDDVKICLTKIYRSIIMSAVMRCEDGNECVVYAEKCKYISYVHTFRNNMFWKISLTRKNSSFIFFFLLLVLGIIGSVIFRSFSWIFFGFSMFISFYLLLKGACG